MTKKTKTSKNGIDPELLGSEHILLVDDEIIISDVGERMLRKHGYNVSTAKDGVEALEMISQNNYDLIITDFSMPNMTGADLAREVKQIKPDLPIILFTGFPEKIMPERMKFLGIRALITKPASQLEMAKCIRQVLDGTDETTN